MSTGRRDLNLEPDAVHLPALAAQMGLQGGQELADFGGGGAVAQQQAPDRAFDRSGLECAAQGWRDQGLDGFETCHRIGAECAQARQCGRFLTGLLQREGLMAAVHAQRLVGGVEKALSARLPEHSPARVKFAGSCCGRGVGCSRIAFRASAPISSRLDKGLRCSVGPGGLTDPSCIHGYQYPYQNFRQSQ